jgi:hypothetical protein
VHISGATDIQDFGANNLAVGTVVDDQFDGLTFGGVSGSLLHSNRFRYATVSSDQGEASGGFLFGQFEALRNTRFSFDKTVDGASFFMQFGSHSSQTTGYELIARLDGSTVESFFVNVSAGTLKPGIFGFDQIEFDEIIIANRRSGVRSFSLFDNLHYRSVAEPGTFVLFGLGLIGLAYVRRRNMA